MKAIIIGGGIGGLCTAIALNQVDIEAEVYEQAPELTVAGAGLTLWSNAVRALQKIGAERVLDVSVSDGTSAIRRWDGVILSQIDATEIERRYQAPLITIHRADLLTALLAVNRAPVHCGKRLARYEQNEACITAYFEDGSSATGDILIGADGIHSRVRLQQQPTTTPVYRGYPAWRAVIPFEHERIKGIWGETWGRGSRFGIVPMTDSRVYWFATENRPANKPPANHKAQVLELFGNWHAPIPELLHATPAESILYNDIADIETLPTWIDGRAVLLGDAAHATTPNMGQGACQAIEDAAALAQALQHQQTIAKAFAAYQNKRKQHAHKVVNQSRRIGQVGQLENPLLVTLRDTIMRLTPARVTLNSMDFVLGNGL